MARQVERGRARALLVVAMTVGTLAASTAVAGGRTATPKGAVGRWAAPSLHAAPTRPVANGLAHGRALPRRITPQSSTSPGTLVNDPTADTLFPDQDTQSETTVVHAGGTRMVAAFNDSGSYNGSNTHFTGYATSPDNGRTWIDRGVLPASAAGDSGDPGLAYSAKTGTVFLSTLGFTSGANIQVFRSTDGGVTFGSPVGAYNSLAGADLDKEWIAVDNYAGRGFGAVYVVARDFGSSGSIRLTRSLTDDGLTWGPAGGVEIAVGGQGAFVTVGPDHSVYVFWFDGLGHIAMRRSTTRGRTFGSPVIVTGLVTTGINGDLGLQGGFRTNAFPQVVVSPTDGALYAVYNDDPDGAGPDRADVFMRTSTTHGTSWSAAVRVNSDAGVNDQFMPAISMTPNGARVMVGWYDRRNDPADNLIQHFGVVGSVSGGSATFLRDFPMSPAFPVVVGQDPIIVSTYMGDYDTITSNNAEFVTTWGDNRDSDSVHSHQPDVRRAHVDAVPANGDLVVSQSLASDPVPVGGSAHITVNVKQRGGTGTLAQVSLKIVLSPGLSATSVVASQGACNAGAVVTCVLGAFAPAHAATIAVSAVVVDSGSQTSTARVAHAGLDSVSSNDKTTLTVHTTGSVQTDTFSTDVDCAVPDDDPTGVDCPLTVSGSKSLVGVAVRLRMAHTYDGDLEISLVGPDGTSVSLVNREGGSADDFGTGPNPCGAGTVYTVLDDRASSPVGSGFAPFAGSFRPESPLSAFLTKNRAGTWKLHVADVAAADLGTVYCWSLVTRTGS